MFVNFPRPHGLKSFQQSTQSYFVTFTCYHRRPRFDSPAIYDLLALVLEEMRCRFALCIYGFVVMPEHVHLLVSEPQHGILADAMHYRYYGAGYLHFITTSCYQRLPLLGSAKARDLFVRALEQVRRRYHFVVVGYVVMPEHVHLLISEPGRGNPSTVMQVVKQSFARCLLRRQRARGDMRQGALWNLALDQGHVWQRRFYDFVIWSEGKRVEKLSYMHRNPVTRGLVLEPQQWRWSSFRHYAYGEVGPVLVNKLQKAELKFVPAAVMPTLRKPRRVGQPC
ncbi:MAG TPA: transposase [Terriglobales bacterium]|nr:transposase [Terriglobales bacterium]